MSSYCSACSTKQLSYCFFKLLLLRSFTVHSETLHPFTLFKIFSLTYLWWLMMIDQLIQLYVPSSSFLILPFLLLKNVFHNFLSVTLLTLPLFSFVYVWHLWAIWIWWIGVFLEIPQYYDVIFTCLAFMVQLIKWLIICSHAGGYCYYQMSRSITVC